MKIWLIQVGEFLPIDKGKGRLWRVGLLARALLSRGHEVTWWTSTFDHTHKKFRFNTDTIIKIEDKFKIGLLHGMGYKKNVSLRRIFHQKTIAKKFLKLSKYEPAPDIIQCGLPTLEFCSAAIKYGEKNKVPIVLDIRDLWPEIWIDIFPKWMEPFTRFFLSPMFISLKNSCSKATAVSGITPAFVQKGISYAGRSKNNFDRDFPLGYPKEKGTDLDMSNARAFWGNFGISKDKKKFIVCYFGVLSKRLEFQTIFEAAKILGGMEKDIIFIICGKGELSPNDILTMERMKNIIFPGWVGFAEIKTLMEISSVGVIPYPSRKDFIYSIPNKAIEYLAGGLPILSSIRGVLENMLSKYKCGFTYQNKNPRQLASLLCEIVENTYLRKKMSDNASRLFFEKFSADKVYGDMSENLEKVAKEFSKNGFIDNGN